MEKLKIGLIGLGNRGSMYYEFANENKERCEVVAAVDFNIERQMKLLVNQDIKHQFKDTNEFFKQNFKLDLLIISSMDKYHYQHSIEGLKKGYNLLLEKPIACKMEEVHEIQKIAKEKKLKVIVCHVLRYTKFYRLIKDIIDNKELGEIVNLTCSENVAYWHQCHSYVRGNWHNVEETAPQILTKSSHDLDIIQWLMGKKVNKISSFGSLFFFKKEKQFEGAAKRCFECPLKDTCEFNAYKFYLKNEGWLYPFVGKDLNEEKIDSFLRKSDFGRCVFDMDNNTVDHQVVNIEFVDNTTASFTLNAFSKKCYRDIKVYGTKGDICANFEEQLIHVNIFNKDSYDIDIKKLTDDFSGHGGGDRAMFNELLDYLIDNRKTKSLTLLDESAISHKMAFLAEESRLNDGKVKKYK